MLGDAVLCCATLRYAVLCHDTLCYAVYAVISDCLSAIYNARHALASTSCCLSALSQYQSWGAIKELTDYKKAAVCYVSND